MKCKQARNVFLRRLLFNKTYFFLFFFVFIFLNALYTLQRLKSSEIEPEFESRTTTQKVTELFEHWIFNVQIIKKKCQSSLSATTKNTPKKKNCFDDVVWHSQNGNRTDHEFSKCSWILICKLADLSTKCIPRWIVIIIIIIEFFLN